ncbi:MAG: vWA domain-containing protein, partial [Chloroflexota bacterium]
MFLTITFPHSVQAQDPAIEPRSLSMTLMQGECETTLVTIHTPSAPPPKLDVLFVVDVTSSMQSVINQVAQDLPTIVSNIRSVIPDTTIGLATVADYPAEGRSAGIEPWAIIQPLSQNMQLMQEQLGQLTLFSSGDEEEAYLRALYETQFLDWRPDARRLVILLGDAPVHDPDLGRDGIPNTADDLTSVQVVEQLQGADITILALSRRKPAFFTFIGEATGGQFILQSNLAETPDIIQRLLTETINRINVLDFRVSEERRPWVSW